MFIKRFSTIILIIFACLYYPGQALAQDDITNDVVLKVKEATVLYIESPKALVKCQEKMIDPGDPQITPIEKNGRTLLPLRFVSESLGAAVSWDSNTNTAEVKLNDTAVKITIGKKEININGNIIPLDVPAEIRLGKTYVPLRALSEALNYNVFYARRLIIVSNQKINLDPEADKGTIDELIFLCTGTGNSLSNLMGGADFGKCGDWVVFYNPFDNCRLYKSKFDGSKKTKLSNDEPSSVNIIGNWIYYTVESGIRRVVWPDGYSFEDETYEIHRIKIDGTGRTRVGTEKTMRWMAVSGDWIFYINDKDQLTKMRVDGTEQTRIGNVYAKWYNIGIYQNWIYFVKAFGREGFEEGLWRTDLNGTKTEKVMGDSSIYIADYDIQDGYIYLGTTDGLYRLNLDGTGKVLTIKGINPSQVHVQ